MDIGPSAAMLPTDREQPLLVGRLLLDQGPTPVLIRGGMVEDVSAAAPTVADLLDDDASAVCGRPLFPLADLDLHADRLLAPIDLQVIKAAGVTFAVSAIEQVIEERARGDYQAASAIRDKLEQKIGGAIRSVVPGTPEAQWLKAALTVANITKIAFGGPDLRTAYATTARQMLTAAQIEAQPQAGDLFSFHADVPGVPCPLIEL